MYTAQTLLTIGLVLAVQAPCLGQGGLARPAITKLANGTTRVVNTGPSQWTGASGWQLVYERTVQPPEGAAGVLDNPWGAVLASDGTLFTLDLRNPAVRSYDAQGRFLRSIGRPGEGPGEYKTPFIALDGDTLYLYDPSLHRLTVLTLAGTTVRTVSTTANDRYPIHFDNRGFMAIRSSVRGNGQWIFHDRRGRPVDSMVSLGYLSPKSWKYPGAEGPSNWAMPFPAHNVELLLPTGGALIGRTDEYSLVVTKTGTDTAQLFSRVNPPRVAIPATARDSAFRATVAMQPRLQGVASLSDVPTTYPLWRSVHTDASGNIWVMAPTATRDRSRFDVFSPDGVFLGEVTAPFNISNTVEFHGDRLTVIGTDADDLPRIQIYRIDRRGR